MSTFNFDNREKELIRKAIAERRSECQGELDKKHIVELNKIEGELSFELSKLTPMNESILIGCLRETYVYPNEHILRISDYELMFRTEELSDKLENLDNSLNVLNKLLKKSEPKYRLFSTALSTIEGIKHSNKIFYSSTSDGKIYKAGILVDGTKGISFELDGFHEPTNFSTGQLNQKSYMDFGTPVEVKELLNSYAKNHKLSTMQESFSKIVKQVCG